MADCGGDRTSARPILIEYDLHSGIRSRHNVKIDIDSRFRGGSLACERRCSPRTYWKGSVEPRVLDSFETDRWPTAEEIERLLIHPR